MDRHPAHHVEDLSYAGQGAVLVNIGEDVGALVVHMPADMAGEEIEIRPAAEDRAAEHRPHVAVLPPSRRPRRGVRRGVPGADRGAL
jgi:hypothetical protein